MHGPACVCYLGELGYEIMYAGILRKQVREYERLVVVTRPDRVALHADYASEVVPHSLKCVGASLGATPETTPSADAIAAYVPAGHSVITPADYGCHYLQNGTYIVYGQHVAEWEGSIVLHARERDYCSARDWTRDNWNRLASVLANEFPQNRLVCIGSLTESHPVEGCYDFRGRPLQDVMNLLRSANVFIGQSSGPAHLASHCACPHIVWCEPFPYSFYVKHWNPHRTWVRTRVFPGDPHKPSFEMVRGYVMRSIEALQGAAQ